ncbi:unnamed protein product [Cylicostephanus goldi]|uniref:SSD domain-containing protein n=1 Tax=Cylicostephanus goldi TaxID=71465 RepID=A0A3P6R8L7_CYLGO|nr:unnamed protein product [Cylicostephanus goldi]
MGVTCWVPDSNSGLDINHWIAELVWMEVSVGVDDVFIILRAWDRTSADDDVPERMALTLEESGPSILISSITNAMAFFIGMTSQTPAVRSFSLYSAIAISICFFYQLIMFSAVLSASGYRERRGMQSFFCCKKANPKVYHLLMDKSQDVPFYKASLL